MAEQVYFSDDFVNVKAGEPIRLFKKRKIYKGGKVRDLTRELLERFRLPHFKPAIKLGSHADTTPAGGHITKLEVKDDGLYAHIETNDEGGEALEKGSFKYHSPEVIWPGRAIENPDTGKMIEGPLIVGLALTHTPHLGEAAAMYSYEPKEVQNQKTEKNTMTENTVQVDKSVWDTIVERFFSKPEPTPEPEQPEVETTEKYTALEAERDDYKTKYEAEVAERKEADGLAAITDEFDTDEFGAAYKAMPEADGAVDVLASMNDEQRDWALTQFKAMSAQIDEAALLGEKGSEGKPVNLDSLNDVIQARMKADGIDYNSAATLVFLEQPEFAKAQQAQTGAK